MIKEQKIIAYKGQVVFEKIVMSQFHRIPKLFQDNEACFMFVNKGEFSVRTPSKFISFKKDKGLLAKCFDYFFETSPDQRAKSHTIEVLGILLYPSVIEELFHFDLSNSTYSVDYNVKRIQINHLLNNYKKSIDILLNYPELADEEMIKTKLKEFVLLISKTQKAPSQLDFLSALFKKKHNTFAATVHANLYSNLSVNEFAHLCGMSISTFKRRFYEEFSESPKRYVAKMKLIKASKMLLSKNHRISDIAYDCGYESVSTFNRSFKAYFDKSPTEYRLSQFA
ncbi:helix-turn-helix domain-containing protein [Aquimarina sediminis]|uniref:helix-turn-helix domain-containing protein n=1 Tax=Aquimarina sediminis TaxID=2070536 RepID=UPI000CA0724A|nr:AraC family transcriptional regulator [Aquimarina sediminis]